MANVLFDVIEDGATVDVINQQPVIDVGTVTQVVSVVTVEGPVGARGLPGTGVPIFGEQLTGTIDGVNTIFTTAHNYLPTSTSVFLNGLRESLGIGYNESGVNQITFTSAPWAGDNIRIDYVVN